MARRRSAGRRRGCRVLVAGLVTTSLLAGCGAMQSRSGPDGSAEGGDGAAAEAAMPVAGGAAELTRYATALRALSAEALEREYHSLIDAAQSQPSIETDIKLSLLLSNPAAPFRDIDQATRLLGGVMLRLRRNESDAAEFARLVYYLLSEQSCVAAGEHTLAQLVVAERERVGRLDRELGALRAALASEREHRQTLQRQLNALRALEERITLDSADSSSDDEVDDEVDDEADAEQ